jgi:hypothetical protein
MKLRVHSWGGLGSQLFALSLIFDLMKKFPKKRIELLHHTAGVTRRLFELDFMLSPNTQLIVRDDFVLKANLEGDGITKTLKINLLVYVKYILNKFRISINFDRYQSIKKIKSWSIELRGHYSQRPVSSEFLEYCLKTFNFDPDEQKKLSSTLIVHYRLGDLLTLPEKSIIQPETLIIEIMRVLKFQEVTNIDVYSDSTEVAKKMLSSINNMVDTVRYIDATTREVIENSIHAQYFIGTNSKVSIWILKLRNHLGVFSKILEN